MNEELIKEILKVKVSDIFLFFCYLYLETKFMYFHFDLRH